MGLEQRNGKSYYYRKVWRDGRCISEYVGAGTLATCAAALDECEREEQAAIRVARRAFEKQIETPQHLRDFQHELAQLVYQVYTLVGYHRHKGQWRKQRMTTDIQPMTQEQALTNAKRLYRTKKPTDDQLAEYKRLLQEYPVIAERLGSLARIAEQTLLTPFEATQTLSLTVNEHMRQLRASLGYADAPKLEQLLIEQIALCWVDYYRILTTYGQQITNSFSLNEMEQWDRILSSKQQRYLRAIEALARVRRLNISIQLNIAEKQVNVMQPGG